MLHRPDVESVSCSAFLLTKLLQSNHFETYKLRPQGIFLVLTIDNTLTCWKFNRDIAKWVGKGFPYKYGSFQGGYTSSNRRKSSFDGS